MLVEKILERMDIDVGIDLNLDGREMPQTVKIILDDSIRLSGEATLISRCKETVKELKSLLLISLSLIWN
ncbi:hypothetical protein AVEN_179732-1 [Araneus ventricosus]|uniref:Uncharacterized protein n=1 Tax=Araneus ventricosus TaxID=182803 RepID=A0A4Y2QHD5_ARAVE|nr:hypothetical protein AVEN_179732-1 [Araneus ventricosus]